MTTEPARGVRNNNPGNIRKSDDKWQGLADEQTDPAFFVFASEVYGVRALARLLINYQDRQGLRSIERIIGRYAPSNENDTEAYIATVSARSGLARDARLDLHSHAHLRPLIEAMIWVECRHAYPAAVIDKALVLAGVEPPEQPLAKTRTVKGAQVATVATGAAGAITMAKEIGDAAGAVRDALGAAGPFADLAGQVVRWSPLIFAGLALAGILYMVWARLDDRRRGLR